MNPLTLELRSIKSPLTIDDDTPQIVASDGHDVWLDSSFALQHGLEVVELDFEVQAIASMMPPAKRPWAKLFTY